MEKLFNRFNDGGFNSSNISKYSGFPNKSSTPIYQDNKEKVSKIVKHIDENNKLKIIIYYKNLKMVNQEIKKTIM